MEWTVYVTVGVIQLLATFIGFYIASYIRQKGKNLATREDIQEITDKVESVKTEYAKQLEGLKSHLNAKFHAQTVRFGKEFKVYEAIWTTLLELRNATVHLHTTGEQDPDQRWNRYREAFKNFYPALYGNQPFVLPEIFSCLDDMLHIIFSEATDYEQYFYSGVGLPDQIFAEAMDRSEKNRKLIEEKMGKVCTVIRERVESW